MQGKKIIGIIPARLKSERFPEKVLADLCGKPMIQHVYERALKSTLLSDVWVACDDQKIFDAVKGFGGRVCMTAVSHPSGTDRAAEAVQKLECDYVVNLQADEPLIEAAMVDAVIKGLLEYDAPVSTLAKPMKSERGFLDPNVVKVVCSQDGFALYFSRAPIPYLRGGKSNPVWLKHIGLYGYRRDFLVKITKLKPTSLELTERLEQLRILETGSRIKVMLTETDTIGVDTPENLEEVRRRL